MPESVKKEATNSRPSVLSSWYRKNLGPQVAITNIDWVITSIHNKDKLSRYLIIEEKNTSSWEKLYIGLGEARSYKEVRDDITKNNIPIIVVFIKDEDMSSGVYYYKFNSSDVDDKRNYVQLGSNWYIDVKKHSHYLTEQEFIKRLKSQIKVSN